MYRYLVLTFRTSNFQTDIIEAHYAFLERLRRENKLDIAGPFTDKTGGAYLLLSSSLEEAQAIAYSDPVHISGSSTVTVYEWNDYQIV